MTSKSVTLSLNLSDSNFSGLGRRKYDKKYTKIPVKAYPEDVLSVFTALYNLVGLTLNDETAAISILASEEGFPQRLIGPKVFQIEGTLGLKIDKNFFPFTKKASEDEVTYKLNGKNLALQAEGKQPVFKLTLGAGLSIKFPIYINKKEDAAEGENPYFTFSDLEETLSIENNEELIKKQVGNPSSGEKTNFSALKYLPEGSYKVLTAKNETGKYGSVLAIQIKTLAVCDIEVQEKNPETEKWEIVTTSVKPGSILKVQGNTSLKNSLLGAELSEEDNVLLTIVSKSKNKDGNIVVVAHFDYSESRLKFEF